MNSMCQCVSCKLSEGRFAIADIDKPLGPHLGREDDPLDAERTREDDVLDREPIPNFQPSPTTPTSPSPVSAPPAMRRTRLNIARNLLIIGVPLLLALSVITIEGLEFFQRAEALQPVYGWLVPCLTIARAV
jgi:hypothetical protein